MYTPFISIEVQTIKPKFTLQKNAFDKKNYSGHAE